MAGDYYKWLGIICFKNVYNKIYNKDKTNSLRKKIKYIDITRS